MAALPLSVLGADEGVEDRPSIEASEDLDWYCLEAASEMGESSTFGALLERASLARRYERDKRDEEPEKTGFAGQTSVQLPSGPAHYGEIIAGGKWREWVATPSPSDPKRGHWREVWGARPQPQYTATLPDLSDRKIRACTWARNVGEVLALIPKDLRRVLLTHHEPPRPSSPDFRGVFAPHERIVHLTGTAASAFKAYRSCSLEAEATALERRRRKNETVHAFLERLAWRFAKMKKTIDPREVEAVHSMRYEATIELRAGYVAYEEARARLPNDRRYPFGLKLRGMRKLTLVGGRSA